MDAFGPTLDYFCKRQGIRIQDLAEQMGVSRNTLTNWKAKGKPPTSEVTVKLATILYLDERETDSLLLSAGYAPKYSVKESNATFPNKTQQIATNSLENSIRVIVAQTTEQASGWLEVVRETIFDKGREISEGKLRNTLYLDEREQRRHLGLALKNAIEGGLAMFHTTEEREQYRQVLGILSELGAHSDALRRDVLKSFMLSETPDLTEFNAIYSRSIRIHTVANKKPGPDRDATPYLSCFFDALLAELYADQFFRQQMSDALQLRASKCTRSSVIDVIAALKEIGERLTDSYTAEEFECGVEKYTTYIERILQRFKVVGVVPKGREKIADPALNNIFVPLRVAVEGPKGHGQVHVSILDVLEKHPHVVLLGGPGSGKSTAMRYLAWSHAAANLLNPPEGIKLLRGRPLPLRIELRRLSATRARHPEYDILTYASEILLGQGGSEINQEMFRQLLERRGMMLLFDGLDEVATLAERSQMIEEIENFALSYPGNRIVVTSRPVGYDLARFANEWFVRADIQAFNDEQIRQFLERWYQHVLGLGEPIPQEDREEMEVLYETLKKNERLHKLAENPLLLSVITELHRYKRLPERRIEIYDECAQLLLEKWASLKGTDKRWKDIEMSRDDQFACVAYLGMVLHKRSQDKQSESEQGSQKVGESSTDVTGRFLQREIERFIKEQGLITEVTKQRREAERFLALMHEEAGLIVERGKGEDGEELYGFMHRTFQEYFAAMDVYEQYEQEDNPEIVSEFLQEHLHDPHWHWCLD
ncbi:MAG: NACHT domain-containing protein [Ktedonobacteraceae bacterium]